MSLTLALAQVIKVIKSTKPATSPSLGKEFRHDPAGAASKVLASRRFWPRIVGGAHLGPPTLTLTRANYDVEVVFEYAHADDQTAREVAIVEDYVVVVAALSDQRNLERAASKIEALGHGDRDRIFTFVTEDVDGGGRRLRIRFPLQVVSSP